MFSMIFHFHECGSASISSLSNFCEDAGLSVFTASKSSYLKGLACQIQNEIHHFGVEQASLLAESMTPRSITVAQDETFFRNKPCLVGIEPVSNYILLEKMSDNRKTETWNTMMNEAMTPLPVKIIQSTSDEGRSLLKHTRENLNAAHSPDIFHIVQDAGRSGSASLKLKEKNAKETLIKLSEKRTKTAKKVTNIPEDTARKVTMEKRLQTQIKEELEALEQFQQAQAKSKQFNQSRKGIGRNYHPYDLQNGLRQSPEKVEALLTETMQQCKNCISELGEKAHAKLAKAMKLIPAMKATLIFFFNMADTYIGDLGFDVTVNNLIKDELMPAAYLKIAASKEKNKKESARLLLLSKDKLHDFNRRCGAYSLYSSEQLQEMWEVACEAVQIFQRSSSCVEGRNAQLTLKYHNLHRLTESKLKSLTVIHNFHTKRSDGTTPAERFFRQKHESLFEAVYKKMPLLARPRKHVPKVA